MNPKQIHLSPKDVAGGLPIGQVITPGQREQMALQNKINNVLTMANAIFVQNSRGSISSMRSDVLEGLALDSIAAADMFYSVAMKWAERQQEGAKKGGIQQ